MEQLPTGFRFYPTEEELISFYLHNKLHCLKPEIDQIIPSIDIYNFEPSQLPEKASQLCHKDTEQWFFFMPQQEREARGGRPNRTTTTGYWKATGSPSYVYSSNKPIGVKKTMVFYMGKAPTGRKTKWKMNEYKAIKQEDNNCVISTNASTSIPTIPKLRHEVSLCRVYVTSGCARAFDRRPPPITAATTTTTRTMTMTTTTTLNNVNASASQDINNNCPTTFGYNVEHGSGSNNQHAQTSNNVIMVEEKSSSPDDDSSNSEGDFHGTPQGPSTSTTERDNNSMTSTTPIDDFGMTESLDSFMDWEQLDWL